MTVFLLSGRESKATSNRVNKSCNYGDSRFNGGEIQTNHNQHEVFGSKAQLCTLNPC